MQIIHAKLRTNCSALAKDLFNKNILDSPYCLCGEIENAAHFFLKCPRFTAQRNVLMNEISQHSQVSLKIILFGNSSLNNETNTSIFSSVHSYLSTTKRFSENA